MAIDSRRRQQASNPNTPPEKLRKLADCEDASIRQLVVANPNTPTEVLWRLGEEFPSQLLANPVLPLLYLEHLNLIDEIPLETLIRLFALKAVPDYLQQGLPQAQADVRQAIAKHPNTPVHWLELLAQDPQAGVRREIAANPNTPVHWLELLAQDPQAGVRREIAANPNTPAHCLEQLAQDPEDWVREVIAKNPNTPVQWLEQLAQDPQVEVRVAIAKNPNTPLEILKSLGKDNTDGVRRAAGLQREAIAANPNIPVQWLEQLAQDPEWTVRRRIAANPNTPVQWLEQLAQDPEWTVRREIAANPNTPVQWLERLAQDPDTEVRRAIAENSNTPVHCLECLAPDPQWMVRLAIAENPNTPVQWLERLAQDPDTEVRWTIAQNINTPVRVLKLLAQDPPEPTILQKIKLCQTVDIKDWKPKTEHAHFSTLHTKITDAQILIASLLDLGIAVKTNADVRGDNGERVRVDVVAVLEGKYDIGWSLNSDRTYDLIADLWGVDQKHNITELVNSINQKYAINKAYADSKKRDLTNTNLANKCPRCNSTQIKKNDSIQGKQNYKCQNCGTEFQ